MSILIDPYMFELVDEKEIVNNLSFFLKIIKFSSVVNNEKPLKIAIYKGMVEKMKYRSIQPFPIEIAAIRDKDLKSTILQLNQSFCNLLLNSIESIDIEECDGDQLFRVNDSEVFDSSYYELFSSLLIPCYSNNLLLDHRILTGNKTQGKQIGDECLLECVCERKNYSKECRFVDVSEVLSPKDIAVDKLKKRNSSGDIKVVDSVEAYMGKHHNHVQADGKKFNKLDDLSAQNKIVLNLLKELGLFKIIFGRFDSYNVGGKGTFCIQNLQETDTQDILVVMFSAETGMLIETSLYFPKGVGGLLHDYFQKEQVIYKNVRELIDRVK